MNNCLDKLEKLVSGPGNGIDYQLFFRQRGLRFAQPYREGRLDVVKAREIPEEAWAPEEFRQLAETHIQCIQRNFLDILMSPKSSDLLYSLYCSPSPWSDSQSLLTHLSPTLETIASVVRGGPNIYKLNGWLVHVLVGYDILTRHIPRGSLPKTIDWPNSIATFFKETLQPMIISMDQELNTILHVGMFSHDIGVATDIVEHNMHGAPMVPEFLKELNISQEALEKNGLSISSADFIWAIQALVQFHAFINQVGGEFSKDDSALRVKELTQSAAVSRWRRNFLRNDFASVLLLIATSDLIAVNDTLLSPRKIDEMKKGYALLKSILGEKKNNNDIITEGFIRFRHFLGDGNLSAERIELEKQIVLWDHHPDEFWTKFFYIRQLSFALPVVSHLPTAEDTLMTFLLVFSFIDKRLGSGCDVYRDTHVAFDHKLNVETIAEQLKKNRTVSFDSLIGTLNGDCWKIGSLEIALEKDASENIVHFRNA
jgi:hypothetical protein